MTTQPLDAREKLDSKAIDVTTRLEMLAERHRLYLTMSRLEDLPSPEDIQARLTSLLKELHAQENTPEEQSKEKMYRLAAAMASAEEADNSHFDSLSEVEYAAVLSLEAERGRSDTYNFQKVVRHLLAQHPDNYTPTTATYRYDVFSDASRRNVVLLDKNSLDFYFAKLKDHYRLDELLGDFANLKEGTTKEIEDYWRRGDNLIECLQVFTSMIEGVAAAIGSLILWAKYDFSTSLIGASVSGAAITATNLYFNDLKSRIYEDQKRTADFPYQKVFSGTEALLEVFAAPYITGEAFQENKFRENNAVKRGSEKRKINLTAKQTLSHDHS